MYVCVTTLTLCFKLSVFYINICCFINKPEQQVLQYDTVIASTRGNRGGRIQWCNFEFMGTPCCCIKFEVYNFIHSRDI